MATSPVPTFPQNTPNYISKYATRNSIWNRKWRSASLCVLGAVSVIILLKSNNQDYKLAAVQGLAYACFGLIHEECVAKTRTGREYAFKYHLPAALILVLVTKIYCGCVLKLTKVFTEDILSELANRFFIATSISYRCTNTHESYLKALLSAINQDIQEVGEHRRLNKDSELRTRPNNDPYSTNYNALYNYLNPTSSDNTAVVKLKEAIQAQARTLLDLNCLKNGYPLDSASNFVKRDA